MKSLVMKEDERTGIITMKGSPLTLLGKDLKVGAKAPDFKVIDKNLNSVSLSKYKGKLIVISSVSSIDMSVCDMQTRKFAKEAKNLSNDVVILSISMDLPFALKRWAQEACVEGIEMLSDHREADFGNKYGLLIKELRLLARAVYLIDKDGGVRYRQIVNELSNQPNYISVLDTISRIL